VSDALDNRKWVSDIRGALTVTVLIEYIHLWELLSTVVLQQDVEDSHVWQLSTCGQYTTRSAYKALFIGAVQFKPWERIWKSWTPGKCKFFMWTVAHDRCWTTDQLARKGLPHPATHFVTKLKKQLIISWSHVSLPAKCGSPCCRNLANKCWLQALMKNLLRIGGPTQVKGWLVKFKRA